MYNKSERAYQEALKNIKAGKRIPLLRIIRLKCLDCVCYQEQEVRLCPDDECVLHAFRMGKHPIKRIMTEAQRKAFSERMKSVNPR